MIKTCSDERMTYMKKLVMLVTVVLTVAMAAVCFAAGDGNDLNKQQKIVDFTKAGQRYFRDNEGNEICCL